MADKRDGDEEDVPRFGRTGKKFVGRQMSGFWTPNTKEKNTISTWTTFVPQRITWPVQAVKTKVGQGDTQRQRVR